MKTQQRTGRFLTFCFRCRVALTMGSLWWPRAVVCATKPPLRYPYRRAGCVASFVPTFRKRHIQMKCTASLPCCSIGPTRFCSTRRSSSTTKVIAATSGFDEDSSLQQEERVATAASAILEKVRSTLYSEIYPAAHCLNDKDHAVTILLGVSGGCDSVALLHILQKILPDDDVKNIHVVHFDHQQRGVESSKDLSFVRDLCKDLGVPFHCYAWKDAHVDRSMNGNFSQDSARRWRRTTMRKLLTEISESTVSIGSGEAQRVGLLMTAHHKDDSDETLLLKILRGAHITNMVGLPVITFDEEGKSDDKVLSTYWARPMIHLRKSELYEFLKSEKLSWREDASNTSDKYLRNRVRNELIPLLEDMVGPDSLQNRLQNLQEQSTEIKRDIQGRAREYTRLNVDHGMYLLQEDATFDLAEKRSFHGWVVQQTKGHQFTHEHMQRVCNQIERFPDNLQWTLNIGSGWDIQRQGNSLRLVGEKDRQSASVEILLKDIPLDQRRNYEDTRDTLEVRAKPLSAHRFFKSTLESKILYFTPPWRAGQPPIRISHFLRGQKVPLHLRESASIITFGSCSDETRVVAVYVAPKRKWVIDAEFQVLDTDTSLNTTMILL